MTKRTRSISLSTPTTGSAANKKSRTVEDSESHTISSFTFASAENAAAVTADPPLPKLLKAVQDAIKSPAKGESVVYWMRMADLRIEDNRALAQASMQAIKDKIPLIVLFIISPQDYVAHDRSARRIDFTLRNLDIIKTSLASLHIPLHTVTHTPRRTLPNFVLSLLRTLRATRLYANIEYEVDELRRDIKVCELARPQGVKPVFWHDKCIIEPGVVKTKEGKTYTVYSPYQKNWISTLNARISEHIGCAPSPQPNAKSTRESSIYGPLFDTSVPDKVEGFELEEADKRMMEKVWPAGTAAAQDILNRFLTTQSRNFQLGAVSPLIPLDAAPGTISTPFTIANGTSAALTPSAKSTAKASSDTTSNNRIQSYNNMRDRGDLDSTSRLSPYLSAGVISVRECVRRAMGIRGVPDDAGKVVSSGGPGRWVMELAWRDFYTSILAGFPHVCMGRPYHERYADVKWEVDEVALRRWQEGKTGVPIVDAAMRQMNTMGWMHNRMRMISAMFLCKDLMIDWRLGERYFMRNLIDGDLASNNGGWQWSSSTGVDSCPYFRLFNPYSQSAKGDPTGDYIHEFVPELRSLKGKELYNPSGEVADRLGYPRPVVKHEEVRERALRRYKNPGEE